MASEDVFSTAPFHDDKDGNPSTAIARMRSHLALHPNDTTLRLRMARLLLSLGEHASARQVMQPLDVPSDTAAPPLAMEVNRILAAVDEAEGALTSAQIRWERALADDIDDPEARARLADLRPELREQRWPSHLSTATLVSPEGVRTARFKLLRELGRGTTATVYLVRDERLALPLALKVLHPQFASASRASAREKFFSEARVAARLRHPGVVAIYNVDEGARCLSMEFIAGGTLRDRLRSPEPLPPTDIVGIARSMLRALAYVHGAGVVHGDLKPGNMLLRSPSDVVLADFGAAQFIGGDPGMDDRPAGTPLYLAPEQFQGAPPSRDTDSFAVGAILWELAHRRPARRQHDLLTGGHSAPPPPFEGEIREALGPSGPAFAAVVSALLSTHPADRPDGNTALLRLDC